MKYLLKHTTGDVVGLIQLKDTEPTPQGFEEITKAEYDQGISALKGEQFLSWDSETRTFALNAELNTAFANELTKLSQLDRLRFLNAEIALYTALNLDATALQAEFEDLKVEYLP